MPDDHPTQKALGQVETASILVELALSRINSKRLREIGDVMHHGRPGRLFRSAEVAVTAGVSSRLMTRWRTGHVHDLASVLYLLGALAFRYAWVEGGKASAADDSDVAAMGRGRHSLQDQTGMPTGPRMASAPRRPGRLGAIARVWTEAVRRISLVAEHALPF